MSIRGYESSLDLAGCRHRRQSRAPDPLFETDSEKINGCLEFDWGRDPQLAPIAQAWRDQQSRTFEEQHPGLTFGISPALGIW